MDRSDLWRAELGVGASRGERVRVRPSYARRELDVVDGERLSLCVRRDQLLFDGAIELVQVAIGKQWREEGRRGAPSHLATGVFLSSSHQTVRDHFSSYGFLSWQSFVVAKGGRL